MVLVVGLMLILVALPGVSFAAPEPSPSPSPVPAAEEPSFFDLGARVRSGMAQWFTDLLAASLAPVFDLLGRTVFSTPPIHEHERVRDLWRFSLAIADAALVVFLLVGAAAVITTGGLDVRLTAKELIPRLLLAALAVNLSLLALGMMIEISNALSRGIFGSIDPESVAQKMAEALFDGAGLNPFVAIVGLIVVVLAVLVAVVYVIRISVLVVLAAAAPLLLVTHLLPQTDAWARIWWRGTAALLAVPVAQSFLLSAGARIVLSGDGLLGLPSGGLIDLLVIGSILYLLFKIPLWALNAALGGAVSSAWGRAKTWAWRAAKAAVVA